MWCAELKDSFDMLRGKRLLPLMGLVNSIGADVGRAELLVVRPRPPLPLPGRTPCGVFEPGILALGAALYLDFSIAFARAFSASSTCVFSSE